MIKNNIEIRSPRLKLAKDTRKWGRMAILLEGEKEEIESVFLSFWNWGATNGELVNLGYSSCYFWTTKSKLKRYYENIIEHKFCILYDTELNGRHRDLIEKLAEKEMNKIGEERFVTVCGTIYNPYIVPRKVYSITTFSTAMLQEGTYDIC